MRTFTQLRPAIMFVIATLICLSAIAADQVVTSNADDGSGSLRQAINNVSPGGNITFNLPGGSETITIASELAITKGLTINGANTAGSGTAVTIQVTTPGTSAWRVFEISASGSTINLQNMALQGGDMGVYYGGAIQINAEATVNLTGMNISNSLATNGGGIFIAGSSSTPTNVTVTSSTFNGNSASNRGGGINVSYYANLTINSCTFINNTSGGNGGAIFDGGMVTITKSTFSENNGWYGGAICNFSSTTLTVVSSTISGNVCGASSNGGGGIYSEGSCYLLNSIVINNTPTIQSGADITIGGSGSTFAYYSWYSSTSGTINTQASAPNVTTAYTPGDLVALANNGGPTKTMALSATSPARNNGIYVYYNGTDGYYFLDNQATPVSHKLADWATSPAVVPADKITTDQRGSTIFGTPAIGAYNPDPVVLVTATAGTATGGYATLKAAFDAINAGTHKGGITVMINSSTTETAAAVLNASSSPSSYTSVNIYPTASGLSVSGDLATPLIDLNGADHVTIDGRVNATGSAKDLVITNTSTSATDGTSTIRFIKVASSNTVKYCVIKGSSLSHFSGGIIYFTTADYPSPSGNDNNIIDHNDITCSSDANRPINAIFALGTSLRDNSGNVISNNNLFNFMGRGSTSNGIFINLNNTNYTITGNSFYETSTFVPTSSTGGKFMIYINSNSNFSITGNYIGGTAPLCGGTALTKSSSPQYDNIFEGIYLNPNQGAASSIQGNTISNISWTNSGSATWIGIETAGPADVNIGTTGANTIGAPTGNSSISYTCGATGANFYGMYLANTGTTVVLDNLIGSITTSNAAAYATNIYGIYKTGAGTTTISNNTVGSNSSSNSINAASASATAGNAQLVYGIYSAGSGSVSISNNTVSKLTNGTTNIDITTAGLLNGIATTNGVNTISNNTVRDLTIGNANYSTDYHATVTGICQTSTSAGQTVSGNVIYNLSNTYSTPWGMVCGLYYSGGTSGTNVVSKNFIYNLIFTNPNTNSILIGMNCPQGSATYSNNIISLGINSDIYMQGIYENCVSSNNTSFYFNTVYLSGAAGTGSEPSSAFKSDSYSNTKNIRNNIFVNSRTGTTANRQSAIRLAGTTGVTIDYNDYYAPNAGGVLGQSGSNNYSTLSDWQTFTGQDSQSKSADPGFASAGGIAADNYKPSNNTLIAVTGTGITKDYGANDRSATYPAMGAWEYDVRPAVSVTATSGTLSGGYPTLKAAFDAINAGTHQGDITVMVNKSTTETTAAVLNASSSPSSYTSVNIYPTVTGLSISGNPATPLIDLNGADNVTIDGRVNATGSTKDLVITNTSTSSASGTSTIRFINDAGNNTVKYCTLKGSSTATLSGGVVFFSATTGATGNDGNTVDNNNITNSADANRPLYAVLSIGTAARLNSSNTISNNNIYDFFSLTGSESYGVYACSNTTDFSVTGNDFYETTTLVPTAGLTYYVLRMGSSGTGSFTVTGNQIGGNAAGLSGTMTINNSSASFSFTGISLSVDPAGTTSVQNNTIRNISITTLNGIPFMGIYLVNGKADIGTVTGNTIGSATGNGSITISSNSGTGGSSYGIRHIGSYVVNIRNNVIGSVTTTGSAAHSFYAIDNWAEGGTVSISNNLIGSTDAGTANSIYASSSASSVAQMVYGIKSAGSDNVTISGNTIAKLTNGTTSSTSSVTGAVNGIQTYSGSSSITNNTVRDLTIANANNSTGNTASVIGICQRSTSAGQTLTGNTIYNLSNTNSTSVSAIVIGIYYSGGSNGTNLVSGNFIHSLTVSSSYYGAGIRGLQIETGTTTFANNIISLGTDLNSDYSVHGITENCPASNNPDYYFNTVYLGGNAGTGSQMTHAFVSTSTTNIKNIRNNIFINARTGTQANHQCAVRLQYMSGITGLTIDNNDYYAPNTGGVLGKNGPAINYTTLSGWQGFTGQDSHSNSLNPSFASAGGTNAADYKPSAIYLVAATGTGITTDYGANTRSVTYPAMGAWEYPVEPPCANPSNGGAITADQSICPGTIPAAFTSTTPASGQTGILEYKWQLSTTSSSTGFSDISAATSETYAPGPLTITTWYQRLARVTCMADWTGAVSSNVLQVTVYNPPVPTAGTVSNVSCFGGSNGEVSVSVSGGATPYTYLWTGGSTGNSVSGLTAGTYNVTVTDAHSCTGSSGTTVTEPSSALTATASVVSNVSIYLGSDGSATVTPGGGTTPYSYSWSTSPAQTNQTATSLTAGTYWVTVTDANSCTATSSATITQPTPPSGQVADIIYSNVGGHQFKFDWTRGNGDGCAVFVLQGTTGLAPPVNNTSYPANTVFGTPASEIGSTGWYCVYDGTGTTVTVTGLSPSQDYRVHICEYKLGSKTYNTGTANNNPLNNTTNSSLSATASVVSNVSCFGGSDGSVTVSASGGNPSYTYAWSTIPAQTSATVSSLTAGIYTVTVTDGVGETVTSGTTVAQPDLLTATAEVTTNVSCFGGSNGVVNVIVSGGTGPFTYYWSTGAGSSSVSNLTAGTYDVTVTDAHSCTATSSATVTEPAAALTATAGVLTPVSCYGGSNGSVDVTVSGGTSGYSYAWSSIPLQTTHNATGLMAGTYWVTVTDAHSCTATSSATLAQPSRVVPGLTGPEIICQNSTGNVYTTEPGMSNYHWVVSAGGVVTAGGTTSDNSVTITWSLSGAKSVSINYSTPAGCTADDPTIKNISVSPSPTPDISGPAVVNQGETATYSTPFVSGHQYNWNVVFGTFVSCDPNCITVHWAHYCNITVPGQVIVTETDPVTGCSKTVTLLITIN